MGDLRALATAAHKGLGFSLFNQLLQHGSEAVVWILVIVLLDSIECARWDAQFEANVEPLYPGLPHCLQNITKIVRGELSCKEKALIILKSLKFINACKIVQHVKQLQHVCTYLKYLSLHAEAAGVPSHSRCWSVTSLLTVAGWVVQVKSFPFSETVAGCRGVSLCPEHGNAMEGIELL